MRPTPDTTYARPRPAAVAASWAVRALAVVALLAGALLLLATVFLLGRERSWRAAYRGRPAESEADRYRQNEQAYFHGTIGTELAPLPVLLVLPALTEDPKGGPSHFYPFGREAGTWAEQFGFLPASLAPGRPEPDPRARALPLGFTVSHYRPKSGAPSPVPFVGLTCAACHTSRINGRLVVGTGNSALNLFAWIDAFQAALADPRVTYAEIVRAYEQDPQNPPLSLEEKGMIRLWLQGAHNKQAEDAERFDAPFGNGLSVLPAHVATGPCRTQPFRTLVRTLMDRPGAEMHVYTKIAALYRERPDEWGQFDGGIHGLYPRSAGAALAAGATRENMGLPEIGDNIRWASDYITVRPPPTWAEIFPDRPVGPRASAGEAAYRAHCDRCHGHPEGGTWKPGARDGELVDLREIGTDPERVTFRYFEKVPDVLTEYFAPFPEGHPFHVGRGDLRPLPAGPEAAVRGYINKRMYAAFSRAPFLHNGSVLTLAELINLEPRRAVFFRGANGYDAERLGLAAPAERDHDPNDHTLYFRFDTALPGNSNRGHEYPWPWAEVEKDPGKQEELRALLEYLRTL